MKAEVDGNKTRSEKDKELETMRQRTLRNYALEGEESVWLLQKDRAKSRFILRQEIFEHFQKLKNDSIESEREIQNIGKRWGG